LASSRGSSKRPSTPAGLTGLGRFRKRQKPGIAEAIAGPPPRSRISGGIRESRRGGTSSRVYATENGTPTAGAGDADRGRLAVSPRHSGALLHCHGFLKVRDRCARPANCIAGCGSCTGATEEEFARGMGELRARVCHPAWNRPVRAMLEKLGPRRIISGGIRPPGIAIARANAVAPAEETAVAADVRGPGPQPSG